MGAEGASLDAALTYSNLVFGGAILIWLFNLLVATVRGTGNLILPVFVVCGGALLLVPLSPLLIFGLGGIAGLGVAGGAVAILAYYALGSLCFAAYLWGHRGVLHPSLRPPKPAAPAALAWEVLRGMLWRHVHGGSSSTTNITIAILTGYVGLHGVAAVAGYGAGARLEFLLVPLTYGIGGPAGILIGTSIGAGDSRRALRTAWIGDRMRRADQAEAIGSRGGRLAPGVARRLQQRPDRPRRGRARITCGRSALFFGFFSGLGYALYCAGQGTGRMEWLSSRAPLFAPSPSLVGGGLLVIHTQAPALCGRHFPRRGPRHGGVRALGACQAWFGQVGLQVKRRSIALARRDAAAMASPVSLQCPSRLQPVVEARLYAWLGDEPQHDDMTGCSLDWCSDPASRCWAGDRRRAAQLETRAGWNTGPRSIRGRNRRYGERRRRLSRGSACSPGG